MFAARRRVDLALIAAGCLLVAGCTSGSATGQILPDADARREHALRIQELARGDAAARLTSVTAIDVDSRGAVYVGDWYRQQVAVLGPDGSVARTLGRRGNGPGEFQSIRGVQLLRGDSLLVYDPSLGRVSVYAPDASSPAYTVNLSPGLRGPAPFQLWRAAANDGYVALFRPTFMFSEGQAPPERKDAVRILGLDGTVRATVQEFPSKSFLVAETSVTPNPFGREGLVSTDSKGTLLLLWNDSLNIRRFSPEGAFRDAIRIPFRPLPVTDAHVRRQMEQWDGRARAMFSPVLEDSTPESWPVASAMLTDDEDRLWIALAGSPDARTEWIVLSRDLGYVASVYLPARETLRVVRNGRLYVVRMDENDVPVVVTYGATGIPE